MRAIDTACAVGKYRSKANFLNNFTMLLVACSFIVSCGNSFSKSAGQTDPKPQEPVAEAGVGQGIKVEVQPVGDAKYSVLFLSSDQEPFSILKHDKFNETITELVIGAVGEFSDTNVEVGYIYEYEIGTFDSEKTFQPLQLEKVAIPYDIVLEKNSEISLEPERGIIDKSGLTHYNINRLDLAEGSRLVTHGGNVVLNVTRLYSQNGTVKTFAVDETLSKSFHGMSGGDLRIKAINAVGHLNVKLIGESAQGGLMPSPQGESGRGAKGPKGKPGKAVEHFECPYLTECEFESDSCITEPGAGGRGGQGKKGSRGNPGGNGGDTGLALLLIERSKDFSVSFIFSPGAKGLGSVGGAGGPGGYGGDPGFEDVETIYYGDGGGRTQLSRNDIPKICPRHKGPIGPEGEIGDKGADGQNGKIQKACYSLASEHSVKCVEVNSKIPTLGSRKNS